MAIKRKQFIGVIILLLIFISNLSIVGAESKTVELGDVFKAFSLEKSTAADFPTWRSGTYNNPNNSIHWLTDGVKREGNDLYRYGKAVIAIDNYYGTVLRQNEEPYEWNIILNQKANRPMIYLDMVQRVIIHATRAQFYLYKGQYPFNLVTYLQNIGVNCEELGVGNNKIDYGWRLCKVDFDGKRPIWIVEEWSHGASGRIGNLTFVIYYSQNDAEMDFQSEHGGSAIELGYRVGSGRN